MIAALAITDRGPGPTSPDPDARRRVDGGFVVNGAKTFITGGVRADLLVTAVRD